MTTVTCYACETTYADLDRKRCDCGEPTWVATDASGFDWTATHGERGIWQYADVLPAEPHADLTAAAGGTPLVRTPRLDDYAGCQLSVKDEGENPTGSFKDRGSAVAVAHADTTDHTWVGTVSHGNMAMSTAAYAAARGLDCVVFVPARIPDARLGLIAQYDPTIVRVDGDYGRLYHDTLALEPDLPVDFVNSDAPLRVEGQKTTAYEILHDLAPDTPDAIVLPVSSGGHASALWKALRELHDADVIDDIPPLYLAQAAAVDPIAQAYRRNNDHVTPVDSGDTIAFSISNVDPPSGTRALTAARDTDGAVVSVTDDQICDATNKLASHGGLTVEPASATALAATRQLTADGTLDADDHVVAIATGTGFKEFDPTNLDIDTHDITLTDLADTLTTITD